MPIIICNMKNLPLSTVASFAHGIVQSEEREGLLRLSRFDAATLGYYEKLGSARHDRALCTAGVTLAFQTDSSRLALTLDLTTKVRAYSFADVCVDGVFAASAGAADGPDRIDLQASLPGAAKAMRAVVIYLPHGRAAAVRALALEDGARAVAAETQPVLLALGDSITQGMNAHHPALTYGAVLARSLNMTLLNQGVGGHVFDADGLCAPPHPAPALITVAYGINDWNQGLEIAAARPWLVKLHAWYPATPTFVFEPIWAGREGMDVNPGPNAEGRTLAECRSGLGAIVRELPGMKLVRAERLLPPVAAFLPDGVHPDNAGHVVYGLNAATVIAAARG